MRRKISKALYEYVKLSNILKCKGRNNRMKKRIALMLTALMCMNTLAGCGGSTAETPAVQEAGTSEATGEQTQDAEKQEEPGEAVELKIWHDGNEAIMQTIADEVNETLTADGITVRFEKKTDMPGQLKLYGTDAENAPDMYFYAHDVLGSFVAMDLLAPLSDITDADALVADALPMTVKAGQLNETQYLLPVYFETLLFIYNQELWEGDVPETTEGLYEYMTEHTDTAAGTYAVVNQHTNAYNVSPFINGLGGYVINEDAQPGFTDEKTMEAVEYNKKFALLEADGDYNTVTTLFNEGKASAIIGGPWLIPGIEEAGISYGVVSLSDIKLPNGEGMAPYSGIQGVGVLKTAAETKKEAIAKALAAMSDPKVGIALAKKAGCAPANSKAYEDTDVAANEVITAIQKTASTAQPMPNIPEMSVMWGPAESLFVAVNKNGEDVEKAAQDAQKAAEQAIADMQ